MKEKGKHQPCGLSQALESRRNNARISTAIYLQAKQLATDGTRYHESRGVEGCRCGEGDREILRKRQRLRKLVAAPAAQLVLVRLDYTRLGRRGKPSVRVNKETARPRLYAYLRIVSLNCLCTGYENRLKARVLSVVRKQLSVISCCHFFYHSAVTYIIH